MREPFRPPKALVLLNRCHHRFRVPAGFRFRVARWVTASFRRMDTPQNLQKQIERINRRAKWALHVTVSGLAGLAIIVLLKLAGKL
jgi:hypothetical protein